MKATEFLFGEALNIIVNQKFSRHLTAKKFDKFMFNRLSEDDSQPSKTNHFRYLYYSSVLNTGVKNLDKQNYSKKSIEKIIKIIVDDNTFKKNTNPSERSEKFKSQYGDYPPGFVALSPTQRCNLNCTGCYASSDQTTVPTLSFTTVDKIIGEVYQIFGRRFIVLSGGEPFLYKSEGKTLLDIFQKYNDVFFLVYTNGTLITDEVAQRLAELGNVTPAISVEGFEVETDERRGSGVHKRILKTFQNLRNAGVPFGISVTATRKNCDVLLKDDFYDYYFEEQGATYMFQFQFMPIGRGKETFDLMVEPKKRIQLYKAWERLLEEKRYPVADFWNSALLTNGCIAYGRMGGYLYIDWNGNIMPCVFVPYYEDNIVDLYSKGKSLVDATKSLLMKRGRQWQKEYSNSPDYNYLMPCSIRDHYTNFRENIFTKKTKPENLQAEEALIDESYYQQMEDYDRELKELSFNEINANSINV
jgi:MoaA/NifB/PqqE/SkfB family radical SAM enzyme